MTNWNPNKPDTIGLEFFATQQGDQQLPAAVTFTSTATETVSFINANLRTTADATVLAEVYTAGNEIVGSVSTTVYRPNADVANQANAWLNEALSPTTPPLYQSINEATVDNTDFIFYFGPQSPPKHYRFNVASAGWAANRRVIGGFIRVRARRLDATGQMYVAYYNGTSEFRLGTITLTEKAQDFNIPFPEYNPGTNLPWTQAEIAALDGAAAIQFKPKNINKRKPGVVYQAYLSLDWVTENRLAVGTFDLDAASIAPTPIENDTASFPLVDPNDGTSDWSKANATDYTILFRRIGGFGVVSTRFVTETPEVSEALLRPDQNIGNPFDTYLPVLDARGLVSVMGDPVPGRAEVFALVRSDLATSVDGQPYSVVLVGSTTLGDIEQEITPAAGGTYDRMRALIQVRDAETDLIMKIKRRSDNVQFGSTETLTPADALLLPLVGAFDGFDLYLWEVELLTPATLSTVQYYVEFDSAATNPWTVIYLDGGTTGEASFGGATDNVTADANTHVGGDAPVTLSTEVDPPDDLAAETDAVTQGDGAGCTVPTIDEIQLTWTQTILGGDFGGYQIERNDDGTWQQIRYGTEESAEATDDGESIRGAAADYRIRVVRAGDYVPSGWADPVTATANAYGSEVIFASNWLGDAEAVNRTPEYEWGQPNNDRVLQLSGRDYQIVFQESENRGDGGNDGFEIEALVFTGTESTLQPTPDGRAAFAPLIDFLRTTTPYLAVLDFMGGRWYGRATVDEATIAMNQDTSGDYVATVRVVVTQDEPTPAPIPLTGS